MAVLKGVSQRTLRGHIAAMLRDKEIEDVLVRAETVELPPVDGYRKHEMSGRFFMDITLKKK